MLLTYMITTANISDAKSPSNGWAILLGLLNGLFYGAVFLPRLVGLIYPDAALNFSATPAFESFILLIRESFETVADVAGSLWTLIEPARPIVILLILLLIVVGAASTIRGGARA